MINSRLENDDIDYLAYLISLEFPNECRKTYYVPPVPKKNSRTNKPSMSKGKLTDKYRNKCTFIRSVEHLEDEDDTADKLNVIPTGKQND